MVPDSGRDRIWPIHMHWLFVPNTTALLYCSWCWQYRQQNSMLNFGVSCPLTTTFCFFLLQQVHSPQRYLTKTLFWSGHQVQSMHYSQLTYQAFCWLVSNFHLRFLSLRATDIIFLVTSHTFFNPNTLLLSNNGTDTFLITETYRASQVGMVLDLTFNCLAFTEWFLYHILALMTVAVEAP